MQESVHKPVLLKEVVEYLSAGIDSTVTYLDGTLGGAGHAKALAEKLNGKIKIIGLDRDPGAIERAKTKLAKICQDLILEESNFADLEDVLEKHGVQSVDLILLDLGISSDELDNSGKGFTFQRDEPLVMTFGDALKYPYTAKEIVNVWEESTLADIIFGYGEDRFARRIAKAIVNYRTKKAIETSGELAEIVKMAVPAFVRRAKIHPATKTFQALRIVVNDELNSLKKGLESGFQRLNPKGKMAVISFHSLEDRIVKNFFREKEKAEQASILTKKPVIASESEVMMNPRSRSAKLRVVSRAGAQDS